MSRHDSPGAANTAESPVTGTLFILDTDAFIDDSLVNPCFVPCFSVFSFTSLWFLSQMQKDVQLQISVCEKSEECLGDTRHDPLTTDSTQTSTRLALESLLQKNPAQTSFSRFFSPSRFYRNVLRVFPSSLSPFSLYSLPLICFPFIVWRRNGIAFLTRLLVSSPGLGSSPHVYNVSARNT